MRVRRRTLAVGLPVALVLGLGACTSDDVAPETPRAAPTSEAPSETPTAEPTETPEPEPTESGPTPPARPAAMDDTGKKGAQAAAEYFIAVLGYSPKAGDSTILREMTYSSICKSCTNFIDEAEEFGAKNYVVTGGEGQLTNIVVSDRDELTGGYAVSAAFETEEMVVTDPDGSEVTTYEYDKGFLQIDVVHDGDGWRVMAMVTDQDGAQ